MAWHRIVRIVWYRIAWYILHPDTVLPPSTSSVDFTRPGPAFRRTLPRRQVP